MSSGSLELVFYGRFAEGESLQVVKEKVAALFKAPQDKIDAMFSGKRVVIKNGLDEHGARKYLDAMTRCGAVCQVELMGAPGHVYQLPDPGASASATASNGGKVESSETVSDQPSTLESKEPAVNPERLKVAGERTDEVLAGVDANLAPVGSRLSDAAEQASLIDQYDRGWTIAPVGSDLQDEKEDIPAAVPDISHLELDEPK